MYIYIDATNISGVTGLGYWSVQSEQMCAVSVFPADWVRYHHLSSRPPIINMLTHTTGLTSQFTQHTRSDISALTISGGTKQYFTSIVLLFYTCIAKTHLSNPGLVIWLTISMTICEKICMKERILFKTLTIYNSLSDQGCCQKSNLLIFPFLLVLIPIRYWSSGDQYGSKQTKIALVAYITNFTSYLW